MVAMKKTLLEIVQSILNDLDSDEINSIGDTVESTQVANIVADVYFDLISDRVIPEHYELFRLESLNDNERPTYFKMPDNVANLARVWYNKSRDGDEEYQEIFWREPLEWLRTTSNRNSESLQTDIMLDINGNTELLIFNDRMPRIYTSLDNTHLVMDSFDSGIDTTLTDAKVRAYGELIPEVTIADTFIFDFESKYFPYLLAEAKSRSFSVLHKTIDQKVEQVARRHKSFIQKEKWRVDRQKPNDRVDYGRNSRFSGRHRQHG